MTVDDRVKIAGSVINELGGPTRVGRAIGVPQPVVSNWKARGIPRPWLMVLKKEHPNLKSWKLINQEGGN